MRIIHIFILLGRRFQLKWARCPLLNVIDFRFWLTFGANCEVTSSKFWKINTLGVGIRAGEFEKISKSNNRGDGYSVLSSKRPKRL